MNEPTDSTFESLGLGASIVQTLTSLGYEAPTPIQQRTIPLLLSGRNVIGQAQTGTGKTAAFALPILEKLDAGSNVTQALVLTPTRELAMQVAEAVHTYAHARGNVSVLPVYGGAPIVHQLKRLERGVQVVVGTPGRLIDHLDRGSLRLDGVRFVVLDEADEMLKMGFIDDVERILSEVPAARQIALFSATMSPEVLRIAQRHLADAERVEIEHRTMTAPAIEQRFLNVSEGQKLDILTQILELEESDATLIFRRTKTGAAELAERLEARGFGAVAMHGDMKQSERESVIRRLRAGTIEIVVATDVAARGLDVEQITHVVNYDIPYDVEAYVHRIGRTGRAGRAGMATLFITPRERKMMREIERFTGRPIKPLRMPTQADVAARRLAQLKETIRKSVQEGDLDVYVQMVEQLGQEGPHDIADIAAAAARVASQARPAEVRAVAPAATVSAAARREPVTRVVPAAASAPEREAEQQPADRPRKDAPAAPVSRPPARPPVFDAQSGDDEPKTRLVMSVGKLDGIRPADVVGSIANEAGIAGRDIGPIQILDEMTFVTIPTAHVETVLAKVGRARFRGRAVNLRVAGNEEAAATRPSRPQSYHAGRPAARPGGDRPRPAGRTGSERPGGRFAGDRPREERTGPRPSRPAGPPRYGSRDDKPARGPRAAAPSRYGSRDDKPTRGPRPGAGAGYAPRDDRRAAPARGGAFGGFARPERPPFRRDDREAPRRGPAKGPASRGPARGPARGGPAKGPRGPKRGK